MFPRARNVPLLTQKHYYDDLKGHHNDRSINILTIQRSLESLKDLPLGVSDDTLDKTY